MVTRITVTAVLFVKILWQNERTLVRGMALGIYSTMCPQKNKANYFYHSIIKAQLKALIFGTAIKTTASLPMIM